jgi:DNA polymerase III epsilon subunit-like protein
MGDPFSVAGTAVGITSLGIRTFQILYTYYSQYKGFHSDIDNVLRQVKGLQGILENLRQVKERFEIDNHAPSSQLHLALEACEAALKQLKHMADKCNTTNQVADVQTRVRNARKRLLWPYKKDTLSDMQTVLSRFQDNLSLALQSAGLDAISQRLESLHPALSSLENRALNIQNTLIQQTGNIEALHQDTTKAILVQHQHHEGVSGELKTLNTQILQQHDAILYRLDVLVSGLLLIQRRFAYSASNSYLACHLVTQLPYHLLF